MKEKFKIIFATLTVIYSSITVTYAQSSSYENFEWEVLRLGYGYLAVSDIQNSSIAIGTEVRYNISDFYSIGIGGDAIASISNIDNDDYDLEVLSNTSLTLDRYFSNTSANRPFLGVSLGYYDSYKRLTRDDENLDRFDEFNSLGFGLRVGYDTNRLRINAQYLHSASGDVLNGLSLTAGLTLWGNYKGKRLH